MDRRFIIQALNDHGISADTDDFLRAEVVAHAAISEMMRSGDPGTDGSRWTVYAHTLMRELKCEGEALESMRVAMRDRHQSGNMWTHVEDGTAELLERLRKAGYRLGVVSNADGRVASYLETAGLAKYFDIIVDSHLFGVEKPDPRIFQHALQQLDVAPENAIYVGDVYEVDVLGARAAGIKAILLHVGDRDPQWDCDVVHSLRELIPQMAVT
jgi:putative hydrolase of the HAD superfamily